MALEEADERLDELGDHGDLRDEAPRYRPKIMTELTALAQNR
jgi:hypothetical protein